MGDATKLLKGGFALPEEVHRELARERRTNNGQPGELYVFPFHIRLNLTVLSFGSETYLRKHPTQRDQLGESEVANGNGVGRVLHEKPNSAFNETSHGL